MTRLGDDRPTIYALTGIRAIAATWVVAGHFRVPLLLLLPALRPVESLLDGGYLGVEIFFVLSGFIISYNYAGTFHRLDPRGYRGFVLARVARIYPVHLMTLFVMATLIGGAALAGFTLNNPSTNSWGNVFANAVMLQTMPGFSAVNGPAWSVACEMGAYLLFPVIAFFVTRISAVAALAFAFVIGTAGVGSIFVMSNLPAYSVTSAPMVWTRIGMEFVIGSLLWRWWAQCARESKYWDLLALASLGTVFAQILWIDDQDSPALFLTLPAISLFLVACASSSAWWKRALSSRLAQFGGKISYSVYMTHFIFLIVADKLIDWDELGTEQFAVRLAIVASCGLLVVGLGFVTFYLVEEPGRRILRRFTNHAYSARTARLANSSVRV